MISPTNIPTDSLFIAAGLRSQLIAPMISNDKIIGAVALMSTRPDAFGLREQNILERLASQVSPAIENAQLYQEARERPMEIQRLNESAYRILDSNPSALVVLRGADRAAVTVNISFCTAFGLDKTQVEGQALSRVLDWVGLEECIHESLASSSGAGLKEMKYPTLDGTERWCLVSAVPLLVKNDAASENEILLVLNDITEQRRQQERLQEHSRLASVGELASGVAHEINNPLAAILGLSELIQMENSTPGITEDARKIQDAALRAAKVVQNLLSFARKSEPEKRHRDIASVVDRALLLKVSDLKLGNIQVTTDHSEGVPPTMVDDLQIIQVMLNILTDAEQAIKSRQGPGEMTITTKLVSDIIRISVSDDGLGIPAEHLNSIFDPFFTTKEVGDGTGLGLSICYGIVRGHGGEMWVESAQGEGATFHLDLPVLPAETPAPARSRSHDDAPFGEQSILVVDDDPGVRDILQRVLSDDGHDVTLASDGESAWNLIKGRWFDRIFLDLRMPGIDGQELYQLTSEFSPELAKQMVFITGDTVSADARKFLYSTSRPVLSKQFTIEAVRPDALTFCRNRMITGLLMNYPECHNGISDVRRRQSPHGESVEPAVRPDLHDYRPTPPPIEKRRTLPQ